MEEIKSIPVRHLYEAFDIKQISGDNESLNRRIVIADTNRPGLELAGYFDYSQSKRLVILGDKEIAYIENVGEENLIKAFDFITADETPAIIISKSHDCPEVLQEIAQRKNFPIFKSSSPTTRLIVDILAFLDEELAISTSLHGGLLSIFGKGVLIRGESGMGKSEIALELIQRGHGLVADDRVDCYRIHNKLVGTAPEILKEMLEIRGIGIINIRDMFGISSFIDTSEIHFEVILERWNHENTYDRVGIEERSYETILGIDVPKIVVPVREGRSMSVIIETAIKNLLLLEAGHDSAKEFDDRVQQIMLNQRGGK